MRLPQASRTPFKGFLHRHPVIAFAVLAPLAIWLTAYSVVLKGTPLMELARFAASVSFCRYGHLAAVLVRLFDYLVWHVGYGFFVG